MSVHGLALEHVCVCVYVCVCMCVCVCVCVCFANDKPPVVCEDRQSLSLLFSSRDRALERESAGERELERMREREREGL